MEIYETKIICDRCGKDITKMYQRKLCRKHVFWFRDSFTNYDLCSDCDSNFRFCWLKGKPINGVKKENEDAGKDSA